MFRGGVAQPVRYARVLELEPARRFVVCETGPAASPKPRLLDRVREALRTHHYSRRTEKAYAYADRPWRSQPGSVILNVLRECGQGGADVRWQR
jgi:hypothetical protein